MRTMEVLFKKPVFLTQPWKFLFFGLGWGLYITLKEEENSLVDPNMQPVLVMAGINGLKKGNRCDQLGSELKRETLSED